MRCGKDPKGGAKKRLAPPAGFVTQLRERHESKKKEAESIPKSTCLSLVNSGEEFADLIGKFL